MSRDFPGDLDLSWFDAVALIAFTATKETNYALPGRVMRSMIPRVGLKRTGELHEDAVRIALTSGLTIARQSKRSFDERDASRLLMIWVPGCRR